MSPLNSIFWTSSTVLSPVKNPEPIPARWAPVQSELHERAAESNSRFLYIIEQGAVVTKSGSRIKIVKDKKTLLEAPTVKLQGVLLYGSVQISTQCLRLLMDEGIWVNFFTRQGSYKGRVQGPSERGASLRRKQEACARDTGFCLTFAQAVVRGKINGQLQVASTYAKNYLAETLGDSHSALRQSLERINDVSDLDELLGVEGNASRAYFELFRRCNRSDLPFEGRSKRGAEDPVNALLNFGYTLLLRELEGLLEGAGLDPSLGFYHQPDGNRPSLACDWMEEFRQPIVDRLVLSLINRKVLQNGDFEKHPERGGVRLRPDALRKFIHAWEQRMTGCRSGDELKEISVPSGFRATFLRQLGVMLDAIGGVAPYRSHLEG